MIKAKLPVREGNYNEQTKSVVYQERNMDVLINTSVFAQEKWEATFPINAKNETLFAYVARMAEKTKNSNDIATVMSNLKAVYCFIESNELPTFRDFCQLFDLGDSTYLQRLTDKLRDIFIAVTNSSVATPKNY